MGQTSDFAWDGIISNVSLMSISSLINFMKNGLKRIFHEFDSARLPMIYEVAIVFLNIIFNANNDVLMIILHCRLSR